MLAGQGGFDHPAHQIHQDADTFRVWQIFDCCHGFREGTCQHFDAIANSQIWGRQYQAGIVAPRRQSRDELLGQGARMTGIIEDQARDAPGAVYGGPALLRRVEADEEIAGEKRFADRFPCAGSDAGCGHFGREGREVLAMQMVQRPLEALGAQLRHIPGRRFVEMRGYHGICLSRKGRGPVAAENFRRREENGSVLRSYRITVQE